MSTPLDAQWYERFREHGTFHVVEYVMGEHDHREEQQQKFLDGDIENPTFHYPLIQLDDVERRAEELTTLRDDISEHEENEIVRKAYSWRLDQKLEANELLLAIANDDRERLTALCTNLFGAPDTSLFYYTLERIHQRIDDAVREGTDAQKKAAEALRAALPATASHETHVNLPTRETIDLMRQRTQQEFGHYEQQLSTARVSALGIKAAFENALQVSDIDNWSIVVEKTNRSGMSVNHEERFVRIPEQRSIPARLLFGLTVHEIGTHIARRVHGEKSQLQLLGLGLHDTARAEEGIATVREQALSGRVRDFAGEVAYLAVGLGAGLDGTPRDFRKTYEIVYAYFVFFFTTIKPEWDTSTILEKSQRSAWSRCVRTFRGTDCQTPGVVFTKDIVYREGNIEIWDVVRDRPEEIGRFNVGKYDPTNDEHLWILNELGLTL